jgi:FSR family fosmidomycin resistance protein-like MFS transporter
LSATTIHASPFPVPSSRIDYARVSLLSLGHFTNDLYGNLITALMPYLVIEGKVTATVAGLVLLTYLFGSSILQPIFGLLADSTGRRIYVVLGPLWIGVASGLVGWVGSAGFLFALAFLGGIGTAAFHPQAASMVNRLSPERKAWSMSIFSMGGNLGFAVGPVAAALIALAGLRWTPIIVIPGIGLTLLLALYAPHFGRRSVHSQDLSLRRSLRSAWRPLSLIVTVIATRSSVQYALIIFLPLYYHARGASAELGSYYAFVLSVCGALGGLAGGALADRYGRRRVVVGTLVLASPLLYLAITESGPVVWPLIAAGGAVLLASNSVTVVQGQELLPGSTGIASGLTLGFAFGLAGVFGAALTALSDHIGVHAAIFLVPFIPLIAAALALGVPDRTAAARVR